MAKSKNYDIQYNVMEGTLNNIKMLIALKFQKAYVIVHCLTIALICIIKFK
jgi:hypothetical protein